MAKDYSKTPIAECAKLYIDYGDAEATLKKEREALKKRITDYLENSDGSSFKTKDSITLTLLEEPKLKASYKADDRERVHDWLSDQGFGSKIKTEVNFNTFCSTVKTLIKNNAVIPEFITVNYEPAIRVSRNDYQSRELI